MKRAKGGKFSPAKLLIGVLFFFQQTIACPQSGKTFINFSDIKSGNLSFVHSSSTSNSVVIEKLNDKTGVFSLRMVLNHMVHNPRDFSKLQPALRISLEKTKKHHPGQAESILRLSKVLKELRGDKARRPILKAMESLVAKTFSKETAQTTDINMDGGSGKTRTIKLSEMPIITHGGVSRSITFNAPVLATPPQKEKVSRKEAKPEPPFKTGDIAKCNVKSSAIYGDREKPIFCQLTKNFSTHSDKTAAYGNYFKEKYGLKGSCDETQKTCHLSQKFPNDHVQQLALMAFISTHDMGKYLSASCDISNPAKPTGKYRTGFR